MENEPATVNSRASTANPIIASVLSLVPGLGQIYSGQWKRGLALLVGLPVQAALFYGANSAESPTLPLIWWLLLIWIWNIWDAARTAKGRQAPSIVPALIIIGLNLAAAGRVTMFELSRFELNFEQRKVVGQIVGALAKPDFFSKTAAAHLSFSDTLRDAAHPMFETIYLALLGTALSLVVALPLSFFGARNLMSGSPLLKAIYGATRIAFSVLRSVEVLIIAVIAVAVVGIGPLAGVLALAIHGIGALGKLYSEAIESIEHGPIEALRSTGASELQVVVYAVVPQVVPQLIAFTLYRWDINVRMATVIGLVGGGGIGYQLIQYMNLFQWRQAATAIWLIAGVVMLMDYASAVIREKIG